MVVFFISIFDLQIIGIKVFVYDIFIQVFILVGVEDRQFLEKDSII